MGGLRLGDLDDEEIQDALDEFSGITLRPMREFRVLIVLLAIERLGTQRAAAEELELNPSTMFRWLRTAGVTYEGKKRSP